MQAGRWEVRPGVPAGTGSCKHAEAAHLLTLHVPVHSRADHHGARRMWQTNPHTTVAHAGAPWWGVMPDTNDQRHGPAARLHRQGGPRHVAFHASPPHHPTGPGRRTTRYAACGSPALADRNGCAACTPCHAPCTSTCPSRTNDCRAYQKHEHARAHARWTASPWPSPCAHHANRRPCSIAHRPAKLTTSQTPEWTPERGGGRCIHTCHWASTQPAGKLACTSARTACATAQSQNACCLCTVLSPARGL